MSDEVLQQVFPTERLTDIVSETGKRFIELKVVHTAICFMNVFSCGGLASDDTRIKLLHRAFCAHTHPETPTKKTNGRNGLRAES